MTMGLGLGLGLYSQQGGGAAAWTPASLGANLKGWWKADAGVSQVAGVVSAWADQSGNGNDLTASGAPTYSATGFNSALPGITVSKAIGQYLSRNNVAVSSAQFAIFFLLSWTAAGDSNNGLVSILGQGQTADFDNNASLIASVNTSGQAPLFYQNVDLGHAASQSPGVHTFGIIFDGANATVYLDGSIAPIGTPVAASGVMGNTRIDTLAFGARPWNGPGSYFDGCYREIIMVAGVDLTSSLTSLNAYLTARTSGA